MREILVARFSGVGDLVEATRFVHALKRYWPEARFDLLTSPMGRDLFEGSPLFESFHVWDRHASWKEAIACLKRLRQEKYDAFFDLHSNRIAGFLSWFVAAPRKQRVGRGFFARILGKSPRARRPSEMLTLAGEQLTAPQAAELDAEKPYLPVADAARDAMAQRLKVDGWDGARPIVLLAPGSSKRWSSKRWPVENYRALAGKLVARGYFVVAVGSAEETPLTNTVGRDNRHVLDWGGKTRLSDLMALCSLATGAITNDSGPMHIAAAAGVPALALFGPTEASRHGADVIYGPAHKTLMARVPCSPCYEGVCPLGHHQCMLTLTVDRVLEAFLSMLSEPDAQA